eukprot:6208552-Pyramimonas_sp.AAC.2
MSVAAVIGNLLAPPTSSMPNRSIQKCVDRTSPTNTCTSPDSLVHYSCLRTTQQHKVGPIAPQIKSAPSLCGGGKSGLKMTWT